MSNNLPDGPVKLTVRVPYYEITPVPCENIKLTLSALETTKKEYSTPAITSEPVDDAADLFENASEGTLHATAHHIPGTDEIRFDWHISFGGNPASIPRAKKEYSVPIVTDAPTDSAPGTLPKDAWGTENPPSLTGTGINMQVQVPDDFASAPVDQVASFSATSLEVGRLEEHEAARLRDIKVDLPKDR